ncbi:hypothetical protein C5167_038400 [Papaver somniferum]|uniref:WRKY domain-containing protein n=1 Tax=Papaver somniferum TaxID=3469 RepID=A0A4Y7ICS1_PAPSO|nr:probable WRKY transcription factor 14 [Papaver somniferum]RZC45451.1 hypothetical protein C5167_038400 [Papaver somniferum]
MCSFFFLFPAIRIDMEKHQGDLSDMLRVCGGGDDGISCTSTRKNKLSAASPSWEFPAETIKFSTAMEEPIDNFGDPFSSTRDPLLHDLDLAGVGGGIFDNSTSSSSVDPTINMNITEGDMITGATTNNNSVCSNLLAQRILDEEMMKRPNCHVFSRMLQLSPNIKIPISASPRDLSSSAVAATVSSPKENLSLSSTGQLIVTHDMIKGINTSSVGCGSLNNSSVQISSPRYNHAGIKRRKSQAKKVVCIPAPAAVNSRPSGEVVPSDLWAWRKYGQKPIKGSPFPRGYYRCSSSKGCSARKQVERSRTDPNMLVITYTSEHNHPWPTQRNALAGSTRSQPTKNHTRSSKPSLSSSPQTNKFTNLLMKEEHNENSMIDENPSLFNDTESSLFMASSIKEETGETSIDHHHQNSSSIDHAVDGDDNQMRNQGFHGSYHDDSVLPDVTNHSDDFFADLGELEPDLLFPPQGFGGDKSDGKIENKGLDPFSLFDWTGNSNSNRNNDCFSQEPSKRGL